MPLLTSAGSNSLGPATRDFRAFRVNFTRLLGIARGIHLIFRTARAVLIPCRWVIRSCLKRHVKTVLRRQSNGLYFGAPDHWVRNPRRARNFKSIDRALAFIQQWGLKGVEVAFTFENGEAFTGLPPEKLRMQYSQT